MPPQDQEQKKVSPAVWVFFIIALLIDLAKIACFFLNLIPVVGPEISFTLSFYLSVVEVVIVFGGLWALGVYKSKENQFFNLITTFGTVVIDLVPFADDFPFTSPVVFFIIVKAYVERSKLAGLLTTAAVGAATGGAGLVAEAGAAEGAGAARAAQAAKIASRRVARARQAQQQEQEEPDALPEPA